VLSGWLRLRVVSWSRGAAIRPAEPFPDCHTQTGQPDERIERSRLGIEDLSVHLSFARPEDQSQNQNVVACRGQGVGPESIGHRPSITGRVDDDTGIGPRAETPITGEPPEAGAILISG
jgi:hypothetical protein